jgi:hypothetical protein
MTHSSIRLALLAALVLPAAATAQSAPYGLDKRPQPRGSNLDSLLPSRVGAFERPALPPDARLKSDEDLNVSYHAGADSVFVGLSLPESPEDAHDAVETTRAEAIASKVDMTGASHRVGQDPSWFKTATFVSWSRGPYFFYVHASSAGALDGFMRAFPY